MGLMSTASYECDNDMFDDDITMMIVMMMAVCMVCTHLSFQQCGSHSDGALEHGGEVVRVSLSPCQTFDRDDDGEDKNQD